MSGTKDKSEEGRNKERGGQGERESENERIEREIKKGYKENIGENRKSKN